LEPYSADNLSVGLIKLEALMDQKHTLAKSGEKGQVLVILVLVMVVLLGFTALAIDGGMTMMTRKRAQNSADAAAMAAALALSSGNSWSQAHQIALDTATRNGFPDDANNDLEVTNPPGRGVYVGDDEYVQVVITTTIETNFAHFVYDGLQRNTILATARIIPSSNIFAGNAIAALSPDACNALWISGNSLDVSVDGGNVFSNSTGTDASNCESGVQSGSSDLDFTITDGEIVTVGEFDSQDTSLDVDPGVTEGASQLPLPSVPSPDCTTMTTREFDKHADPDDDGIVRLRPGRYTNEIKITGDKWELRPGMYCLEDGFVVLGGEVTVGGTLTDDGTIDGSGSMLYVKGGDFTMSAGSTINMKRPDDLVVDGYQWAGMLMYMDIANDGLVTVSGNSDSKYSGTIYAPGPPFPASQYKCTLTGTSDGLAVQSQILCYSVNITGDTLLDLSYDDENNFHLPKMIELME